MIRVKQDVRSHGPDGAFFPSFFQISATEPSMELQEADGESRQSARAPNSNTLQGRALCFNLMAFDGAAFG